MPSNPTITRSLFAIPPAAIPGKRGGIAAIARAAGLQYQPVWLATAGSALLTPEQADRLAAALGITVAELAAPTS